jgi:hypothetical protein
MALDQLLPPPRLIWLFLPVLVVTATVIACSDRMDPLSRDNLISMSQHFDASSEARQARSTDDFFLRVHDAVPGFAGFMFEQGVPTAYLVQTDLAGLAESVLTPLLLTRGQGGRGFQVRPATYSWPQLVEWRNRAHALLVLEEMRLLNISVSLNRVEIGLAPGASTVRAAERLAELDVPLEVIVFVEADYVPELSTDSITARRRPVMGGLQVYTFTECTAGFNVLWGQDTLRALMVNAHCVPPVGSVSPYVVYQPLLAGDTNRIGIEIVDPGFHTCTPEGEPTSLKCRHSDAALILYDDSVGWSFGHIARTTGSGQWSGSTVLDWQRSRFWITDSYRLPIAGDTAHKIGRTTGWTRGPIVRTCVDRLVGGWWKMCQVEAAAGASDGDSGSPVFAMLGGGKVSLYGILWGGESGSYFSFSPMTGIETEFNAYIDVIVDEPILPFDLHIDGPEEIQPETECLWEGSAAGGTTPIAFTWEINGIAVGNGAQYIGGKPGWVSGSSFGLKLTATNDAGSTSTQITIYEDINAPLCIS